MKANKLPWVSLVVVVVVVTAAAVVVVAVFTQPALSQPFSVAVSKQPDWLVSKRTRKRASKPAAYNKVSQ